MRAKSTLLATGVAFFLAPCNAGLGAAGEDQVRRVDLPERSAPSAELAIAAKTVPAHTAVYIEHTGPYWRLGPLFRQVDQQRRRFAKDAPMYARFCAPPLDPRAASCPTEVGLIVEKRRSTGGVFQTVHREPELVAYCVIPSRVSSMRRHYRPMLQWIRENGYVPAGPVTEVHLPRADGDPLAAPRTEIRIVLRPPVTPQTADGKAKEPTRRKDASPRGGTAEAGGNERAPEPLPPPHAPEDSATEAGAREAAGGVTKDALHRQPPTSPATDSSPQPQPPGVEKPAAEENPALSAKSTEGSEPKVPAPKATAPAASAPDEPATPTTRSMEPRRPVAELVRERQWERIALQLMPEGIRIPPSEQLWFGQSVFRIGAVGKGIEQQFPEKQPDIVALAKAISARYSRISAHFSTDPLAQAVVRIDPDSDFAGAAKRKILRDLDTLLGQVAFRTSDPAEVLDKLAGIVERMTEVMHETKP